METELWPNLIAALHKRKIPLVIANAQLCPLRPQVMPNWVNSSVACCVVLTLIAAQNEEDGARFVALGTNNHNRYR